MFKDLKKLRFFIFKFLRDVKLIYSKSVLRTDKSDANENNKTIYQLHQKGKFSCIHHTNITEGHLNVFGLHIAGYGKSVLAKNLVSGAHVI